MGLHRFLPPGRRQRTAGNPSMLVFIAVMCGVAILRVCSCPRMVIDESSQITAMR